MKPNNDHLKKKFLDRDLGFNLMHFEPSLPWISVKLDAPDIRNTARCADAPMIVRMEQRAIYTLQRIPGRDQERPEHR